METTKIEWCDATINFWWGCTKVSPGCAHCYADTFAHRLGKDIWGKGKPREDHRAGARKRALKLNRAPFMCCPACGLENECTCGFAHRPRVFCSSMADWLDDEVPIEWLADLLRTVHDTPNLHWLLLTKRPENWKLRLMAVMRLFENDAAYKVEAMPPEYDLAVNWACGEAPRNVWIGATAEDQARADERIPALLNIPARVRFLSCEPLLSAVDLQFAYDEDGDYHPYPMTGQDGPTNKLHWVICGGESGHHARPMQIEWAESLADQCEAAGVPFFMKQLGGPMDKIGEIERFPKSLQIRQFPQ